MSLRGSNNDATNNSDNLPGPSGSGSVFARIRPLLPILKDEYAKLSEAMQLMLHSTNKLMALSAVFSDSNSEQQQERQPEQNFSFGSSNNNATNNSKNLPGQSRYPRTTEEAVQITVAMIQSLDPDWQVPSSISPQPDGPEIPEPISIQDEQQVARSYTLAPTCSSPPNPSKQDNDCAAVSSASHSVFNKSPRVEGADPATTDEQQAFPSFKKPLEGSSAQVRRNPRRRCSIGLSAYNSIWNKRPGEGGADPATAGKQQASPSFQTPPAASSAPLRRNPRRRCSIGLSPYNPIWNK